MMLENHESYKELHCQFSSSEEDVVSYHHMNNDEAPERRLKEYFRAKRGL